MATSTRLSSPPHAGSRTTRWPFDTVEINNSFYRLPPAETFAKWREQAPPHFLEIFLRALPRRYRHTVEFRDPTWYDERVFDLLRRYKVALCLHDMEGSASGKLLGPFIYVRFHFGTKKYGGRYQDGRLDEWAEWLGARAGEGLHIFAYFNNDSGGYAPRDAIRLRARIQRRQDGAPGSSSRPRA